MAKKDLTGGIANLLSGADKQITKQELTEDELINSLTDDELQEELKRRLHQKRLIGRGRPRKNEHSGNFTDGYGRTTLIINEAKWKKIRMIALKETFLMKEIVDLALDMVIEKYEAKHGEIKISEVRRNINDVF